jgi:phytoene synthase
VSGALETETSFEICHDIVVRAVPAAGRLLASLPEPASHHVAAILALAVNLRQLVRERDAGRLSTEDADAAINFWRDWCRDGCWDDVDDPIAPAVRYAVLADELPTELLAAHCEAAARELHAVRHPDMDAVLGHACRLSSTLCVAVAHVLELEDTESKARAAELGIALHLTRVLRTVGSELAAGRLHLPHDRLAHYRVAEAHLRAHVITRGYARLIAELTAVAEAYYQSGITGLARLPRRDRRAMAAAIAVERSSLRELKRARYDNLTRNIAVPKPRALGIAAAALVHPRFAGGGIPEGLPDGGSLLGGRWSHDQALPQSA